MVSDTDGATAPRWWQAGGPWTATLDGPAPAPWRPAWGALLAGGEATVPLADDGPPIPVAARRTSGRLASAEAALAWAREALRMAPPGASVALRAGGRRVRWRARCVDDVRAMARELAGWHGAPPTSDGPASAEAAATAAPLRPAGEAPRLTGEAPRPAGEAPRPAGEAPRLTAAQRAVVEHAGGPAVVVAVAGAGKTTTMVARVRHRVAGGAVAARHLLVVSFSRAAIRAVRDQLRADETLADVDVRTFHSLAHVLLATAARLGADADRATRPGPAARPARPPPPDALVARVAERAAREARTTDPDLADAWRDVDLAALAAYRGRCLARLELPELDDLPAAARAEARPPPPDPEQPDHPRLFADFERVRAALGWVDHDQLLVDAWAAWHRSKVLRAWARDRWRAAIVDEAQDVNPVQLSLLEGLTEGRSEVMLVGDDDQSVYGFRGAVPGSLRGFAARRQATVLALPEAFRSRAEPLAAATALMSHGEGRWPVRPRAARGPGGRLTSEAVDGETAEAEAVIARARAHRAAGVAWRDQAVLLRRFAQAPALEVAAARADVPLRLEGAAPLDRQPTVLAAWAGVALAIGAVPPEPAPRERAWRRWLVGPGGLGHAAALAAAARLARHAGDGATAWREAAPRGADPAVGHRLADLARAVEVDPATALLAAATDPRTWPADPPAPVRAAALLWRDRAASTGSRGAAVVAAARAAASRPPARDAMRVTSVHRAKGLEWTVVHVPGMNAGRFPMGGDPEERRLAYVAWTRAREALHLYRDARSPPSPFLADGEVAAIAALTDDLAWLAARPDDRTTLAGAWAQREARERFGAADRG